MRNKLEVDDVEFVGREYEIVMEGGGSFYGKKKNWVMLK